MKYIEITGDDKMGNLDILNRHSDAGGMSLVALAAPWCDYCKSLKKELEKIQQIKSLKEREGIVAYVTDEYHSGLTNMDTVLQGYPTIRLFKGVKKSKDYEGERNVQDLTNYILENFDKKPLTSVMRGGSNMRLQKGGDESLFTKNAGVETINDNIFNKLYDKSIEQLEMYRNSGYRSLADTAISQKDTENNSIGRTIGELRVNSKNTPKLSRDGMPPQKLEFHNKRDYIKKIVELLHKYNKKLFDKELLSIALTLHITLVAAEQSDDVTTVDRLLCTMAYGFDDCYITDKYGLRKKGEKLMQGKTSNQSTEVLKSIYTQIAIGGDNKSPESKIRRLVFGFGNIGEAKNGGKRKSKNNKKRLRTRRHRIKKFKTTNRVKGAKKIVKRSRRLNRLRIQNKRHSKRVHHKVKTK